MGQRSEQPAREDELADEAPREAVRDGLTFQWSVDCPGPGWLCVYAAGAGPGWRVPVLRLWRREG